MPTSDFTPTPDAPHVSATPSMIAEGTALQRAKGKGELAVKRRDAVTCIDRLHQAGCAKILLPRTHHRSLEAVLINTAGGLTGGDQMSWRIACAPQTELIATTQACERIYRALEGAAQIETAITVGDGAHFWWLPQETILFEGARLHRQLDIALGENARVTALEAVLLGRQAMNEAATDIRFKDRWRIRRADALVHAEETLISGQADERTSAAALAGNPALATLVHIGPEAEELAKTFGTRLQNQPGVGISAFPQRMVLRALAPNGLALRRLITPILNELLPTGALPRVWSL